ncbi:hypothetical protein [Thalassobaculum sp.]|jgi:hypothetical protein|uniref:hypothetical protein n=1 Tax=Thalassobaculum sp. TaxID=2022740 RepID=UPI003B5C234E
MKIPFLSRPKTPVVERRRQVRLRTRGDSYVRLEGRDVPLINWSEEGFLAGPYSGGLIAGQKAVARIVVRDYHDRTGTLDLELAVVIKRVGGPGIAARFFSPERYKRQALQTYYAAKRAEVKKT